MSPTACSFCDGPTVLLWPPHPSHSMLSDGRILPRPLQKLSCTACGATSHRERLSEDEVRALYGDDYTLAAVAPAADNARAARYAECIGGGLPEPRHVLEVGCGSGALLRRLSQQWRGAQCLGIDPAAPTSSDPRIVLKRGFLDLVETETQLFDLIVAVNVIEHSHDPIRFLAALSLRLAEGGTLVIVCPAASPPNVELLFYDHLWTLTPNALAASALSAGLFVAHYELSPSEIGDFQMVRLRRSDAALLPPPANMTTARHDYLARWRDLDAHLAARISPAMPLAIFGAGQAAALLRCYAPRIWERTECLTLDDPGEAWPLDKPVKPYDNLGAPQQVLIAVAARSQSAVAERLANNGFTPIRWDDLISH